MSLDEPTTMNMFSTHASGTLVDEDHTKEPEKEIYQFQLIPILAVTFTAVLAWSIVFLRLFF